ncbi:MAG: T9SS type A sorting domain-containing protein [Rhodothermales bacterium]|nr:T9SS type A sorting domain-containing protein [Rhodothermales bacterium]
MIVASLSGGRAMAQSVDLGSEFVVFVDSANVAIPDIEPTLTEDPDDASNPVLRMDFASWASVAMAFDEALGADLSAMVSSEPGQTTSMFIRLRVDTDFQGRGDCTDSGSSCLSLSLFDSFSGPQDRESIDSGAGDAAMRLKWFIPDSLRDGAWHDLEIPLPPTTLAALENARTQGALTGLQSGWHYTGAWAGGYGIGCCGSQFPTSQDSLWREFDWSRVSRLGVQFDFSDADAGSVHIDDWYFGTPFTDVSDYGQAQPVMPSAVSPADGEVDTPSTVTLRWQGRVGAPHEVQVSGSSDFVTLDRSATVASDSLRIESLQANGVYYWRVRAIGRSENSTWTTPRMFTVGGVSVPQLADPAEDATGVSLEPRFVWSSVAGAISYRFQLAADTQFDNVIADEAGIPEAALDGIQLQAGTTYVWRVRAESVQGAGDWSAPGTFTTVEIAPGVPVPLRPAPGSLDEPTSTLLEWSAGDRAATYQLQVSATGDYSAPQTDVEIAATEYQVSGLVRGSTYSWRVRARNTGGVSDWATSWFETEMDPPAATRPNRPQDGAVEMPLTLMLGWNVVDGASRYRVQIAHSVSFDNPVVDTVQVGADSVEVAGLRPFRVHFWRVQAANRGGESAWSDIHTFRTSLNQAPVAVADTAQGPEDVPLDISVLANDVDVDLDPLTIVAHTAPVNGYAYVASPGVIRYVPFENWSGVDSLRYTMEDGRGGVGEADVRVTITPVNDPPAGPEIILPRAGSVLNVEGDPGRMLRVLWNPVDDVEGDTVTYRWEMAPSTAFATTISRQATTAFQAEVSFGELAQTLDLWGLGTASTGTVYHRVVASDGEAETPGNPLTMPVIRGAVTDVESAADLPEEVSLDAVYPNPTSTGVNLDLALPSTATVSVVLVDALGRTVQQSDQVLNAGRETLRLSVLRLPAGVYLVSVVVDGSRFTRTILVTR